VHEGDHHRLQFRRRRQTPSCDTSAVSQRIRALEQRVGQVLVLGSVVRPGQPIGPPRISEIIQELGTAPATLPSSAGPASEWWGSWRSVVRCHSASKSLAAKTTHVATVSSVPKHPEMLCAFGQSPACTAWARASTQWAASPHLRQPLRYRGRSPAGMYVVRESCNHRRTAQSISLCRGINVWRVAR